MRQRRRIRLSDGHRVKMPRRTRGFGAGHVSTETVAIRAVESSTLGTGGRHANAFLLIHQEIP